MNVSIVIPVYNEQDRLEEVVKKLQDFYELIIVEDGGPIGVSNYLDISKYKNIRLITNIKNEGYLFSIKKGIFYATGDTIVTMDGDGEHKPEDIIKLLEPIRDGECDIVFGKRPDIARESEVFLLWFARFLTKEKVKDSGTGFRAIKSKYAKKLNFYGSCTCGTLLQECNYLKMRICEVDVKLPVVDKPRKIAWNHVSQFFSILKLFIIKNIKGLDE